jgi:hypothetical protein
VIRSFSVPDHSGTGAGSAGSSRPSPTRIPTAACVIDFAMLQEINVVVASIRRSGSNWFAGWTP